MPISTFFGLQTSLRGILAHQQAIDTTSHNISNANTTGYSRQEAVLAASTPYTEVNGLVKNGPYMSIGAGVDVESFRRIRDQFLDLQYRAQNMQVGEQDATAQQLDQVQLALAEPGDSGVSAQLQKFWDAWSDVSNAPDDVAARQSLINQGANLAAAFQNVDTQLTTVKSQTAAEYASIMGTNGDVQNIATQISQINATMKQLIANGDSPNDLMDRRDALLDQLSNLGQVSVTDLGNGSINVQFGGATPPLVADTTVTMPTSFPPPGPGGKLGALLTLSQTGGTIDSYLADLNNVVKTLADSVNQLHNPTPPGTGTNFFSYTPGSEAATLAVNVGVSGVNTSSTGAPGANDIAIQIADLRGGTADQLYTSFVTRIGGDVSSAETGSATAKTLLGAIDDRRQSTSGVSLDEEMTNLIRFQRGYQASAKTMSAMDQLLDTLINKTF